ncbi:MAG: helix-turn-helix transcriptional regulator [Bacilli bacterium]|nr:helix-turn-helix transcriptional regulator [Bacilli bacterium]
MFKDVLQIKGETIYSLSKKSGVSYTAINELYRGERTIEECRGKTLKLLADSLGISIDELYNLSLKKEKLTSELNKYFWDANSKELDLEKNKIYIISRLLTYGGYEGYKFLIKVYNYEDFKYVAMKSRQLTPKIASFLLNTYHLKKEDMIFYKKNIDWRKPCI